MKGPFANFTGVSVKDARSPPMWRVSCVDDEDGESYAMVSHRYGEIDFHFASRRDAELAAMALHKAGLDNMKKLREAGWKTIKRTMCEALMW